MRRALLCLFRRVGEADAHHRQQQQHAMMSGRWAAPARPAPFTAAQYEELEHQALIYKYLVAGVPVPPDLLLPIRRGFVYHQPARKRAAPSPPAFPSLPHARLCIAQQRWRAGAHALDRSGCLFGSRDSGVLPTATPFVNPVRSFVNLAPDSAPKGSLFF
jgi:hypothetical protein